MKYTISIALIALAGLMAIGGDASPTGNRMIYYQQPAPFYGGPQRMMYVQYIRPAKGHARSTQATSALVAGETVATGAYVNDYDQAESDVAAAAPGPRPAVVTYEAQTGGEDVIGDAGAHSAESEAEAYPAPIEDCDHIEEEQEPIEDDSAVIDLATVVPTDAASTTPVLIDDDYKTDYKSQIQPEAPIPATVDVSAPTTTAPEAPARRYLPPSKNKIHIELEDPVDTDVEHYVGSDETAVALVEDEETNIVPVVSVAPRRPANGRLVPTQRPANPVTMAAPSNCKDDCQTAVKPLPAGTFFPIDFGGIGSGAAIAIANAFSTGEGGSATSHAIAYGSPDAVQSSNRPSRLH